MNPIAWIINLSNRFDMFWGSTIGRLPRLTQLLTIDPNLVNRILSWVAFVLRGRDHELGNLDEIENRKWKNEIAKLPPELQNLCFLYTQRAFYETS